MFNKNNKLLSKILPISKKNKDYSKLIPTLCFVVCPFAYYYSLRSSRLSQNGAEFTKLRAKFKQRLEEQVTLDDIKRIEQRSLYLESIK
ncbi:MAG: hypothetical protein PG979_000847 [Rickettsia asembonensis]|nr:hypothetical protein [Rickettsia asembonensis]WCR56790.1 MAG: hypothetical protein PG979_000847 [Rickettsia asembonensis]